MATCRFVMRTSDKRYRARCATCFVMIRAGKLYVVDAERPRLIYHTECVTKKV